MKSRSEQCPAPYMLTSSGLNVKSLWHDAGEGQDGGRAEGLGQGSGSLQSSTPGSPCQGQERQLGQVLSSHVWGLAERATISD